MPGEPTIYTDVTLVASRLHTTEWNDGSVCTYEPWTDGHAVGFKITCNGKVSYIYLNPSSGGDSPDVFVYMGEFGDPSEDSTVCFLTPEGVKGFEDEEDDDNAAEAEGMLASEGRAAIRQMEETDYCANMLVSHGPVFGHVDGPDLHSCGFNEDRYEILSTHEDGSPHLVACRLCGEHTENT